MAEQRSSRGIRPTYDAGSHRSRPDRTLVDRVDRSYDGICALIDWIPPMRLPLEQQPTAIYTPDQVRAESPWRVYRDTLGERYAIWRATGNVFRMRDGAVDDDPFIVLGEGPEYTVGPGVDRGCEGGERDDPIVRDDDVPS